MIEDAQEMMHEDPSKSFAGINFLLCGFDLTSQEKIRSRLVDGGATDVGRYASDCTHVIVDKILYDDPICNAARNDGKTLVTRLWVEHSFEVGMPVDPTYIMYMPLRDLNGIPGAKSLVICLTGYQRQYREDIMTMVGLMGAIFSKPLVANKVTHLICYKFEGEKYELARKMTRIKIVNERWLEDSLRAWGLLPEANYDKSGYELEIMEAQANDSEDEAENMSKMHHREREIATPGSSHRHARSPSLPLTLKEEASRHTLDPTMPGGLSSSGISYCKKDVSTNNTENEFLNKNPQMPGPFDSRHTVDPTLPGHLSSSGISFSIKDVSGNNNENNFLNKSPQMPGPFGNDSGRRVCSSASKLFRKSPISKITRDSKNSPAPDTPKVMSDANSRQIPQETFLASDRDQSESNSKIFLPSDEDNLHVRNAFNLSSAEAECNRTLLNTEITPLVKVGSAPGGELCIITPENRKFTDIKRSESPGLILQSALVTDVSEIPRVVSPVDGSSMVGHLCSGSRAYMDLTNQHLKTQSPNAPENVQECSDKVLKTPSDNFKSSNMPRSVDGFCQPNCSFTNVVQQDGNVHYSGNEVGVKDFDPKAELDLLTTADNNSRTKPIRRKLLAKKKLGSRPSFGRGKTSNEKGSIYVKEKDPQINDATTFIGEVEVNDNKGSGKSDCFAEIPSISIAETNGNFEIEKVAISGNETPPEKGQEDDETESPGDRQLDATLLKERFGITVNKSSSVSTKGRIEDRCPNFMHQVMLSGIDDTNKEDEIVTLGKNLSLVDDVAENKRINGEKCFSETNNKNAPSVTKVADSDKVGPRNASKRKMNDRKTGRTTEKRVPLADRDDNLDSDKTSKQVDKSSNLEHNLVASCEDEMEIGTETAASGKGVKLKDSTSSYNTVEEKINNGKVCPAAKTKKVNVPPLADAAKSKKSGPRNASKRKMSDARLDIKKEKRFRLAKEDDAAQFHPKKSSLEGEKENRPVSAGDQYVNHNRQQVAKLTPNSCKVSKKVVNGDHGMVSSPKTSTARPEPIWFILSGHKLQKKEFQKVIRHLKGRVCRDTHQWSYQATHFIVPDPVRRTEKFFAAAASGRWILKTDYLTASKEAERFLAEEPYEWHKVALSEDGAINLEAPRKWRVVREKTGHGAFSGMRVIIYGDCIAPPLETLKRAVKSGDGIILATSPPYTRFLESGVDYAIVSPGMPRVDVWVQEFLRHEVPCVSADYLVDYVCKPGYSLDKHVQYNTHAWAEKSLKKLVEGMSIISDGWSSAESESDNPDVACKVCGSRDRAEIMLICGDEKGSSGCGVGTHIDCCDPPLEEVPEEDWFCPDCISSKRSSKKDTRKKPEDVPPCRLEHDRVLAMGLLHTTFVFQFLWHVVSYPSIFKGANL